MQEADAKARLRERALAAEIRAQGLRQHLSEAEIAVDINEALPRTALLKCQRLARGWSRRDLSLRLDALYTDDDKPPPGVSDQVIRRWEHDARRPTPERINYLCQVFDVGPEQLGYAPARRSSSTAFGLASSGDLRTWLRTDESSHADLLARLDAATEEITVFGLTRNFYSRDDVLPLLTRKAAEVPVTMFIMDPGCESRRDRYRIEPSEASMEDPNRFTREVLASLAEVSERVGLESPNNGLRVYTFNFPCSFAIERLDRYIRVMLYGHGKRGTDGPIFGLGEEAPLWEYFDSQLRWLRSLAADSAPRSAWSRKGLLVRPLNAFRS